MIERQSLRAPLAPAMATRYATRLHAKTGRYIWMMSQTPTPASVEMMNSMIVEMMFVEMMFRTRMIAEMMNSMGVTVPTAIPSPLAAFPPPVTGPSTPAWLVQVGPQVVWVPFGEASLRLLFLLGMLLES